MKNGLIIALAAILVIIIAFIAVFVYNRKYLIMDGPGMVSENPLPTEGEKPKGEEVGTMEPIPIVQVMVGDRFFSIDLAGNSSADAFLEKIKKGNVAIDMSDYGGFEKVGNLPWALPTNDKEITTVPGDLILYEGNKITIYYGENTYKFTKLGHLNADEEEIKEAFGGAEDITAEFSVEWTE